MSQEVWTPIGAYKNNNYEGQYEVSNWGKIRNTKTQKVLKTFTKAEGSRYQKVALYDSEGHRHNLYIHNLVAHYYLGEAPEGTEVDHIDGNAENNSFTNLRYLTHTENMNAYYEARKAV